MALSQTLLEKTINSLYKISLIKKFDKYYSIIVQDLDKGITTQIVDINPLTGEPITDETTAKTLFDEIVRKIKQQVQTIIGINVNNNLSTTDNELTNNIEPFLNVDIEYFDEETEEYKKSLIIPVNSKIRISFELLKSPLVANLSPEEKETQNLYLPITGKYLIPYFKVVGRFKEVHSQEFLKALFKFIQIETNGKVSYFNDGLFNRMMEEEILQQVGLIEIELNNGRGEYEFIINESGIYKVIPDYIRNAEILQPVYPKPKTEREIEIYVVMR